MGEAEVAGGGEAVLTMTETASGCSYALSVQTASPVTRGLGCSGRRSGGCCGRQVRRERGQRQLPNRRLGRGRRPKVNLNYRYTMYQILCIYYM